MSSLLALSENFFKNENKGKENTIKGD